MISVILPSKNRVEQLRRCVEQLYKTTKGHEVETIIVGTAALDLAKQDFGGDVTIIGYDARAVEGWNIGLSRARGDYLVLGADDLWWCDGWLDEAMKAMQTLPNHSGLVGFNDLSGIARDFSTHYMMSRDFISHYHGGVMAVPKYRHYFIDPEACQRAKRAGCYVACDTAIVEHRHHILHKAQMDNTYAIGTAFYMHDESMYRFRAAMDFPDDFERVIA